MEDYVLKYSIEIASDLLLHDIQDFLNSNNKTLEMFNLPNPKPLMHLLPELSQNNPAAMKSLSKLSQQSFNMDQKVNFAIINDAIYNDRKNKLFY